MTTNQTLHPQTVSPLGPCSVFAIGNGFKDIKLTGLFTEEEVSPEFLIS